MPAVSAIPVNGIAGAALFSDSELTFFYTVTPDLLHPPLWENTNPVPLLIAASSCWNGQRLRALGWPTQASGRFCDSGGFVFGRNRSCFPFDTSDYHVWLTAMQPNLAACLDLPCEVEITADNAEVARRQAWTLKAAQQLLSPPAPWAWVPVVQGRTLEQYATHARAYRAAGLDQPLMGIGSLCRRTRTGEIRAIVATVAEELPGVRFHLFGVKLGLLKQRVALATCERATKGVKFHNDV